MTASGDQGSKKQPDLFANAVSCAALAPSFINLSPAATVGGDDMIDGATLV